MLAKSIDKMLHRYGKQIVKKGRNNLQANKATGKLLRQFKYKVVPKGKTRAIIFEYPKYGDVLDKGYAGTIAGAFKGSKYRAVPSKGFKAIRGNKVPISIAQIAQWIRAKGIPVEEPKRVAFLIRRTLLREGRPGTKWLTRPLKSTKPQLTKSFEKELAITIEKRLTR